MKSLFSMGIAAPSDYWMGDPQTIDGNQLLESVNDARAKLSLVQTWLQARPNFQAILGAIDSPKFDAAMKAVNDLQSQIAGIYQRISTNDSSSWHITSSEFDAVNNFVNAVASLNTLVTQHPETTPRPGMLAPGAVPSSMTPWLIGGGLAAAGLLAFALLK